MWEILNNATPPNEDDDAKAVEAKEMVTLAKQELKKFIKQGGSVQEFLEFYHGQLRLAHQEWQETQRSVIKVMKEDPDLAPSYIEEVNKRLASKNIKPVIVPQRLKTKMGISD